MTKTLEDIRKDYNDGVYVSKLKYPTAKKFPEGYIFDEDKSVKWNKEEVQRRNQEIADQYSAYRAENARLNNNLGDDVMNALVAEYGFSREQVLKIWGYAYNEKHSVMNDVFNFVTELADFYEEMVRLA